MVGDRKHDIIGAKKCGIDSIGVKWGYAKDNELEDSAPTFIVSNTDELTSILLK
jgi:phosphoglycolate phosphatase